MSLQQFWQLREHKIGFPEIKSETIEYFVNTLATLLAVPIEIYREKRASRGIHTRWRTPDTRGGILSLGLEGSFSITLGKDSPRVIASLFVFSGGHKLFPKESNQGYIHLEYDRQKGWKIVGWYGDEFKEFLERRYSGEVPAYQSIIIPQENGELVYQSLLHQALKHPVRITHGEILHFSSLDTLFGILEIGFVGELKPITDDPRKIQINIGFQTMGTRLAVGQVDKRDKVLYLESSNETTWNYKWKE